MMSSSTIILSEAAAQQNWEFLRAYFGQDMLISAVVKGNAYGHGINEYVPLAEYCGVRHFSVYNAGEAYQVYNAIKHESEIMIMGAMDAGDIKWAVEHGIQFFVFDLQRLDAATAAARACGRKARVHIEIETGMHRTGIETRQIADVITQLKNNTDALEFSGLCMHFAGAESIANYVRLQHQKSVFRKAHKRFISAGLVPLHVHACCSAAAVRFPEMRYDMVRIGIMQYGFWPSPEIMVEFMNKKAREGVSAAALNPLQRVVRWESEVMSVKHVPGGEYVGYGYSYLAQSDMDVAIVPVGYSHGFNRNLSNTGQVLIKGHRAPVIGIVNMNCVAVDVSLLPEVVPGDEVVMIGRQESQEISVASFGEMTNLLNYELLTRLPSHIPRLIEASPAAN